MHIKILLVEDDPMTQIIHKRILEKAGHTVDIAENGKKALRLARRGCYKLIFMDIGLPDISGIEVTAQIRKHEKKRIPIVALTAHCLASIENECLSSGMDKVANKPIGSEKLLLLTSAYVG